LAKSLAQCSSAPQGIVQQQQRFEIYLRITSNDLFAVNFNFKFDFIFGWGIKLFVPVAIDIACCVAAPGNSKPKGDEKPKGDKANPKP